MRSVTINASASGALVGTCSRTIQARLDKIVAAAWLSFTYSGQAAQGAGAFSDIFKALGVALLLMYMLMMMLFGSVTLPLAVLMSLPLAVVGALGAMALTGTPSRCSRCWASPCWWAWSARTPSCWWTTPTSLRKRGLSRTDGLARSGPTRLRPIVMTTLSIIAVAGAGRELGLEEGSELLKAAALVLIGGLLDVDAADAGVRAGDVHHLRRRRSHIVRWMRRFEHRASSHRWSY